MDYLPHLLTNLPAFRLTSDFYKILIFSWNRRKLSVGALLDDLSVIHDENLVGLLDCGEPVGNRNPLFFSAGQPLSCLARRCVIAHRQLLDKFFAARLSCCLPHFFIGCRRVAESDVFQKGASEQEVILRHKADHLRKLLQRHVFDIHTADGNVSFRNIPEPRDQSGGCRFSAAAWAYQCGKASRRQSEVNSMQHLPPICQPGKKVKAIKCFSLVD